MSTTKYPDGDDITAASIRGEAILAYYQRQVGSDRTAADLIADLLAIVRVEQAVAHGEARAEGEPIANIDSPDSVIEEAQAALETWEADYNRERAAEAAK